MRLIDADALLSVMGLTDATKYGNKSEEQQHRSYSTWMSYEIADEINDSETIDAEQVQHGRWKNGGGTYDTCTACEQEIYQAFPMTYCPYCGAKMDL